MPFVNIIWKINIWKNVKRIGFKGADDTKLCIEAVSLKSVLELFIGILSKVYNALNPIATKRSFECKVTRKKRPSDRISKFCSFPQYLLYFRSVLIKFENSR